MLNFRQAKKKIWVILALFSLLTQNLLPFYSILPNAAYAEDAVVVEEQIPTEPIQEEQIPVEPTQEEQIQEVPISENNIVASDEVNEEVSVPEETPTPTETEEVLGEQVSNDVEEQTEENQENNNSPPEEENTEEEILDVVILNNVAAPSLDLGAFESEASATLTTDKADYAPTDTAIISGSGFNAGATYTLVITSEDEPPTKTEAQVTADESGTFTYAYQLDGIYRPNYKVEAKDSSGNIVAIITFTDSPASGCTVDSAGPNDEVNQKDLTKMCVDYASSSTSIGVEWNWDDTGWSGGSTGDACSLYDTDGDGKANYALCVGVTGSTAAWSYTKLYSCSDNSAQKCTSPSSEIPSFTSTCTASIQGTDPFPTGDFSPNDTEASCTVNLSDVGGVGVAELVDVCSFESASPTSNPADCILFKANAGKLTVTKVLSPNTDSGLFNLQIDGTTQAPNVGDGGTTLTQEVSSTTPHTVGETEGTATSLSNYSSSVVCKDVHGTGSVVSTTGSNPWTLSVDDGDDIVCTITNTLQTATITVNKTLVPANDPGLFNLQIDGSTAGTGANVGDTGTTGAITVNTTGTHTVSETAGTNTSLSDYATTYSCDNNLSGSGTSTPAFSVTANQNVVCTFTNTRDTGSVKVNKKVDSGSGFVDANPGSFTWSLDTVGTNAMGSTVSGVNTGSHDVNENTVTDYHFVGWYPTTSTQYSCLSPQGTTLPVSVSVSTNTTTDITLCNAINTGTVIVHKDVQGPNGEDVTDASNNFKVSLDGGTGQDIMDDLTVIYENVPVGSHTITESLVDTDYTLYGISQTQGQSGNLGGLTINVTAGTNDVYVTNRQKSATITVVKDVVNPDGGAVSDTHPFTVNLTPGSQSDTFAEEDNAVFTVNPGTYTASENDDVNYDELGCLTDTLKTDIVVGSGGSVTITCTNQQKKATIDVIKDVLSPTSGALSDNHAFTAQLNGGLDQSFSEATTASYLVNPGNYSITELSDNNYDYVSCTPDSNQTAGDGAQVTVGSNGSVTVTCTNKQKNAQVTVVKDVRDPNGSDVSDSTNFVVQRGGADDKDFHEGLNATYSLAPGTYTFTEIVTGGYTLNSISNDNDADVNNGTTVTLHSGENQTITFTNYQNAGSISGQKLSDTDGVLGTTGDQTNLTSWVINLYTCSSDFLTCIFSATDTTDGSGYSFLNLIPGYYQVREVLQGGWTALTSLFQNVTVDPGDEIENIDFVNFDNVSVTACKKVDADGNIATTEDQADESGWEMTLLVDGQASGTAQLTERDGCYTWADLGPGHVYGVSEETPVGWTNLTDTTHSFGVATGGSDYTYTFVNFENATIIVHKNVVKPDGTTEVVDPTSFTALLNAGDPKLIAEGTNATYSNLTFGTHTVTEDTPPAGYALVSITDDDGTTPDGQVAVTSGDTFNVYVTNRQLSANLTLVKHLPNDNGGTAVEGDFNVYIDGTETTWGSHDVDSGSYIVSEDTSDGYTASNWSNGCDANGNVTLLPGESKTCEITNDDIAPTITLIKEVIGGTAGGDDFSLYLGGNSVTSGVANTALANFPYDIDEDGPSVYSFTSLIGDPECPELLQEDFEVDEGENITCTITNTRDTGSLEVNKQVDTDGDGVFEGGNTESNGLGFVWGIDSETPARPMGSTASPLDTGSYDVDENNDVADYHFVGWFNNDSDFSCEEPEFEESPASIDVSKDATTSITLCNARDTGTIIVNKIIDPDGDLETTGGQFPGEDWEMDADGFGDASDFSPQFTDADGTTTFSLAKTGNYNVREFKQDGYDLLDYYCDNGEADDDIVFISVDANETVNCTFINTPNGEIHGYKWNDVDGNGQNDDEDLLGGWRIFIDENENQEWDEEEQFMLTDEGEELGWYWFENLFPGTYEICEELQSGWIQTYPLSPTCHTVTLPDTSDGEQLQNRISGVPYNFGNQEVDPILTIAKVNNTGGADKSTGSEVVYTITLEITENDAEDVTVTDLLPEGFTYKGGSWQVLVNGFAVAVPEPVYASPGTWLLGNLNKDDIVELIYTAVISSSQEQGLYKDLAWAKAEGSTILALAQPTGFVAENFVGTQVNVVKSESSNINIEKKVEGEVLGAATEALPATGGNTLHLVIAVLMLVFGLNLAYAGYIIRKRYV